VRPDRDLLYSKSV